MIVPPPGSFVYGKVLADPMTSAGGKGTGGLGRNTSSWLRWAPQTCAPRGTSKCDAHAAKGGLFLLALLLLSHVRGAASIDLFIPSLFGRSAAGTVLVLRAYYAFIACLGFRT